MVKETTAQEEPYFLHAATRAAQGTQSERFQGSLQLGEDGRIFNEELGLKELFDVLGQTCFLATRARKDEQSFQRAPVCHVQRIFHPCPIFRKTHDGAQDTREVERAFGRQTGDATPVLESPRRGANRASPTAQRFWITW